MTTAADPKWPRLLALSVHEFRTPVTVAAGYIRMLLKDRAGAITEQQRRLLEEAEKSCGRLSGLLTEMSDLSNLEARTAPFNRSEVDLHALLRETIDALPDMPDREIEVTLAPASGLPVPGDRRAAEGGIHVDTVGASTGTRGERAVVRTRAIGRVRRAPGDLDRDRGRRPDRRARIGRPAGAGDLRRVARGLRPQSPGRPPRDRRTRRHAVVPGRRLQGRRRRGAAGRGLRAQGLGFRPGSHFFTRRLRYDS